MQAGFDFFGVALVVEGEEAVEDGAAGGLAEGVALALLGGVEAVAPVQSAPAVGGYAINAFWRPIPWPGLAGFGRIARSEISEAIYQK
jgi:hypothetical protein